MSVEDISCIQNNKPPKETMKCVLVSSHGDDIDTLLTMSTDTHRPTRTKAKQLLIKVMACSLAPGDCRVLAGHCDLFQSPKHFPYIPGGDISGIVMEADDKSKFSRGDEVYVMFELPRPLNGLAEYAVVKECNAAHKPKALSFVEASCLPSSAVTAMLAVKRYVNPGDRILVLGGSGGVGSFLLQFAKEAGANYIATTASEGAAMLKLPPFDIDRIIDYRTENWWEIESFQSNPFDIIVDLAVGRDAWIKACTSKTLKCSRMGGRFIGVTMDEPLGEIHNAWQALTKVGKMQWRSVWTSLGLYPISSKYPEYIWHTLDFKPNVESKEMAGKFFGQEDGEEGRIKVIQDPSSPIPFEIGPIRKAFHLMKSRHVHGKVVVEMPSTSETGDDSGMAEEEKNV